MKETHTTCEHRIDSHLAGRIADLTKLWDAYRSGKEDADSDLGTLADYGLCFDYVAPARSTTNPKAISAINFHGAARPTNSASL